MSGIVLTSPTVFVDEFDFTALIDRAGLVDITAEQVERKKSNGGGFKFYLPGLITAVGEVAGYFDPAAAGIADLTPANLSVQRIVSTTTTAGAVEGAPFWSHRGHVSQVTGPPGGGAIGELATFQLATQADTAPFNGVVGMPFGSYDDGGFTGDGVELTGPAAGESLYAALHVTAATGTNLVVKIQSDDNGDFTSATDRVTFSTLSAKGSEWKTVAGDLSSETNWRVVATADTGDFDVICGFGVV